MHLHPPEVSPRPLNNTQTVHVYGTSNAKQTHIRSPSELLCNPADLCPAVGAADPVAAPLLEQQDLAAGALERLIGLD